MRFNNVIPNLLAADMPRSIAFYRDVLGFATTRTVPDQAPFVFAWMQRDGVDVFLNDAAAVRKETPALADVPIGGTNTMFITMEGIADLFAGVAGKARITMPLTKQFYGMTEFSLADPDGYVITFAERTKTE